MDLFIENISTKGSNLCNAFSLVGWNTGEHMAKRTTSLDTLKTFVVTPMELVALGDAIHFYLDAALRGQLPDQQQKHVVPLLQSFQSRLVQQIEGSTHHDESF